jgi:hypothetical protein
MNIALGMFVVLICVFIQAATITGMLKALRRLSLRAPRVRSYFFDMVVLSSVIIALFLGMLMQVLVWAITFMMIGEISDLHTAFYFSLVNFTTLGYGDITLSPAHAILGPMEASNGVLMLGLSTSFLYLVAVKLSLDRDNHPSDNSS